jgi:hypothetical protein
MMKRSCAVVVLASLAGCEHVDSLESSSIRTPDPAPGISASVEVPTLSSETVEREPKPPPSLVELRRDRLKNWFGLLSMEAQQGVSQVCSWRLENPCGTLLTREPDPLPGMLAALAEDQRPNAINYCDVVVGSEVCDTPLVIAFEGEAIQFSDHWPTTTTPWLALDRDGDGAITTRAELFGDATVLASGRTATNGFVALAEHDANRDGVIDRNDAVFGKLLLWADRDGNRTSNPSELRPASDVVISIPLANERVLRCTANDDCEGERGLVHWRTGDGSQRTGAVVDVYIH